MKKIIAIAVLFLVIHNWSDITGYFNPREDSLAANEAGVTLYSTSWCGACKQAKAFLNQHGIAYLEYDVEKSDEGRQQFVALGGRGVPLIVIDGTVIKGFNPVEMKRLLDL